MRHGSPHDELLDGPALGPMFSVCPEPGCTALTMGGTCVAHDPPVATTFERGRPFVSVSALDSPGVR
jgi:hypothetical protein